MWSVRHQFLLALVVASIPGCGAVFSWPEGQAALESKTGETAIQVGSWFSWSSETGWDRRNEYILVPSVLRSLERYSVSQRGSYGIRIEARPYGAAIPVIALLVFLAFYVRHASRT